MEEALSESSEGPVGPAEPVGPVDGRLVPRFAGTSTFARLPEVDRVSDYDVAVLGVPFDNGTSYRPGARFGPMAVRQASRHLRPGYHVELGVAPLPVGSHMHDKRMQPAPGLSRTEPDTVGRLPSIIR